MAARAGESYGSNRLLLSAGGSRGLSTPYITSASGDSLLSRAVLSRAPASPDLRTCTVTLFTVSNSFSTDSVMANESCVITVSVRGPDGVGLAHAARSRVRLRVRGLSLWNMG